jgi:methylated-DNA-[protein]-cysteine S-methyltransferase
MKFCITSPVGDLELQFDNDVLSKINFVKDKKKNQDDSLKTKAVQLVIQQINAYFNDSKFKFDIPLKIEGTAFQKRVWQALLAIPAGETVTYSDLAAKLKTGARAIGNACRANPIPIIIPCHRVVSKQGFGGYAGKRLGGFFAIKKWLLKHEGGMSVQAMVST